MKPRDCLDQRPVLQAPFGSPAQPSSPGISAVLRTTAMAGEHLTAPFGSAPQPSSLGTVMLHAPEGAGEHFRPFGSPQQPAAAQTVTKRFHSELASVTAVDPWTVRCGADPREAGAARSGVPEAARLRTRRKDAVRRDMTAPFSGRRLQGGRLGRAGAPVDRVCSIREKLNLKGHRA
jgi:hypothetical protein